jgi:hypothetical protein
MNMISQSGRARRQKRMRSGRTLTFAFSWEGGMYIEVAFEGFVAHDVINIDGTERTVAAFREAVKTYMKNLDQDTALLAWEDRRAA